MGWTSTGDPYANVGEAGFGFDSEEAAKAFAEKHGWEYVVCVFSFFLPISLKFILTCGFLHNMNEKNQCQCGQKKKEKKKKKIPLNNFILLLS